ncbi:MAG: hypothetical protein QOJ86_406 [Bradyrhizobium sp.]|nr:hypothetical protein [Bradyrhizobium sp.]
MISRRILAAVALLCALVIPAHAQTYNPITNPAYAGGARCNGADDSAAIQAAINALPAQNGYIDVPPGCLSYYGTPLSSAGKTFVTVRGYTPIDSGSGINVSGLVYTGTGARAIDIRDSAGWRFEKLWLMYNNPGFAGAIIDAGGVTIGVSVSSGLVLRENLLGPLNAASVPNPLATCLLVDQAISSHSYHNQYSRCAPAIHGNLISGFNDVFNSTLDEFTNSIGSPVIECGVSWNFTSATVESDYLGRALFFQNSPSLPCIGMTMNTNWYGDVVGGISAWFQLTATGFKAVGDAMGGSSTSSAYAIVGGSGYSWESGNYNTFYSGFGCNNNSTGMRWTANTFVNVANIVVPFSPCLDATAENNTPEIPGGIATFPLPSWTAVLSPTVTPAGFTYNSTTGGNSGWYKKSTNVTDVWLTATITANGTGTGTLTMSGLPFTLARTCTFTGTTSIGGGTIAITGLGTNGTGAVALFSTSGSYPFITGSVINVFGSCPTN